ncbi:MAG: hypothetical protein BMS9Abin28_2367 [Anaerolineae bacterium]|nr:MAG: hypothetical protein BMS9Abin28_2367 [Anaerolineae bacterium]
MLPPFIALYGAKEKPAMLNDSTTYMGLDPGDQHSLLALLDQHGDLIEEALLLACARRVPLLT